MAFYPLVFVYFLGLVFQEVALDARIAQAWEVPCHH